MQKTVEEAVQEVAAGTYVVAVSGGLDSVVLLSALKDRPELTLIVAHFDHGIRGDSERDRRFVQQLAQRLNLPMAYGEGRLGPNASEETARKARYAFLNQVKDEREADAVITGHHADDVVETVIINILRGTHRRGFSALSSRPGLLRPFLEVSQRTIAEYARKNHLEWRDDPTNRDTRYLRNYVRAKIIPKIRQRDPDAIEKLYNIYARMVKINAEIDIEVLALVRSNCQFEDGRVILSRYWFTMLPAAVRNEVLAFILNYLEETTAISSPLLKRASHFLVTAKLHKRSPFSKIIEAVIQPRQVVIKLTKV